MQNLLQNRVFVIIALLALVVGSVGGVFLLIRSSDSLAARTRQQYAAQKAGVNTRNTPLQASTASTPTEPKPSATPTVDTTGDLPSVLPASPSGGDFDAYARPSVPGAAVETSEKTLPDTVVPDLPPVTVPPVPDSLMSQGLPGSGLNSGDAPVTTVIEIDPRRYLFNNMSETAISGAAVVKMGDTAAPDISIDTFAPRGEWIEAALMSNATTNEQGDIDVVAAVWLPFFFQGNKLLDVGDKLLGKASKGKLRDRMLVTFDTIVFKDGRSIPINGVALDTDGTLGIRGYMVGDQLLQAASTVLFEMGAAFVKTFERYSQDFARARYYDITATSVNTTNNSTYAQDNFADGTIGAAAGGLEKISDLIATDIEENKPYVLVTAGTRFRVYLRASIDVSKKEYQ